MLTNTFRIHLTDPGMKPKDVEVQGPNTDALLACTTPQIEVVLDNHNRTYTRALVYDGTTLVAAYTRKVGERTWDASRVTLLLWAGKGRLFGWRIYLQPWNGETFILWAGYGTRYKHFQRVPLNECPVTVQNKYTNLTAWPLRV